MDFLLYSDVQHAAQFSIIVISCPGYIIIAGISSCLLDHVWNDFYLVDSHDFFDCSWVHICICSDLPRLLSLLYAPSSCLIKACIINPTIFESFFLSLCRYDCYIKAKLFCSNSHLMFLS